MLSAEALKSWSADESRGGWTNNTISTKFRPGIAEFEFGHAKVGLRAAAVWPSISRMRPLATNGNQQQGSGVDVLTT